MSSQAIQIIQSPHHFFYEKIKLAQSQLKFEMKQEIEFYVVNLLCDFISPQNSCSDQFMSQPLAFILKDAVESPTVQKKALLKKLADESLYVSGFFQDYFNRKTFSLDYYVDMGTMAYHSLSQIKINQSAECETYKELSQNYKAVVDVLSEISSEFIEHNTSVLHLLERWAATESKRSFEALKENGIIPVPSDMKKAQ